MAQDGIQLRSRERILEGVATLADVLPEEVRRSVEDIAQGIRFLEADYLAPIREGEQFINVIRVDLRTVLNGAIPQTVDRVAFLRKPFEVLDVYRTQLEDEIQRANDARTERILELHDEFVRKNDESLVNQTEEEYIAGRIIDEDNAVHEAIAKLDAFAVPYNDAYAVIQFLDVKEKDRALYEEAGHRLGEAERTARVERLRVVLQKQKAKGASVLFMSHTSLPRGDVGTVWRQYAPRIVEGNYRREQGIWGLMGSRLWGEGIQDTNTPFDLPFSHDVDYLHQLAHGALDVYTEKWNNIYVADRPIPKGVLYTELSKTDDGLLYLALLEDIWSHPNVSRYHLLSIAAPKVHGVELPPLTDMIEEMASLHGREQSNLKKEK